MRSAPPESVIRCHLLDQGDRLGRKPWFLRAPLGFVLPEHTEEFTMPTKDRRLLEQGRVPVSKAEPSWPGTPEEAGPSSGRQGVLFVAGERSVGVATARFPQAVRIFLWSDRRACQAQEESSEV
jgi:hypothetical protein